MRESISMPANVYFINKPIDVKTLCSKVIELSTDCTRTVEVYFKKKSFLEMDQAEAVRTAIQDSGYKNVSLTYADFIATFRIKRSA